MQLKSVAFPGSVFSYQSVEFSQIRKKRKGYQGLLFYRMPCSIPFIYISSIYVYNFFLTASVRPIFNAK